ncbi:DUF2141 domain-containing protein [Sneathiella marina]|uniref:DUF2141 domain-containing protein n=1 Tax=Sneathiella marina TaxID=2950108 RepID=A0ABY4W2D9_9PROT|nr:DUF2141 domain-containing protein [Sneathiella marina]USG61104.1 DUF2141 domain-containing protein [Sneathiella marina]
MPTNKQRIIGAIATIAITIGGAWMASQIPSSAAGTTAAPKGVSNAGLNIQINNVRNTKGKIVVIVFDNKAAYQSFDVEAAVGYLETDPKIGEQASFPDLTQGPYVVFLFHDENGNRDLDIIDDTPTEGFATSGATDPYDPPSFEKASVYPGTNSLRMIYPK